MFDNASNSKKQGDIGLGAAIAWFTKNGWTVSIPLTDSQDYDLVVDQGDGLKKVQIKTSSQQLDYGGYAIELRVMGGNKSSSGVSKFFNPVRIDYLFALTESGDAYLIPAEQIDAKCSIVVGNKYNQYKV